MIDMSSLNYRVRIQGDERKVVRQGTGEDAEPARRNAASGSGAGPARTAAPRAPSPEQVRALAAELNEALGQLEGTYSVSVDEETGMMVVRIKDAATGDIVKQIPPQQVLDASISVEKIIGLLVNDQA